MKNQKIVYSKLTQFTQVGRERLIRVETTLKEFKKICK
jgi:hypothetical protein